MLNGFGGDDIISGGARQDLIFGGDGNDTLDGGPGSDTLFGDAGNDSLVGGDGSDRLNGLRGRDTLEGGAGNDSLLGVGGRDRLIGGTGNDTLNGGFHHDVYEGDGGSDTFQFFKVGHVKTDVIRDFNQAQSDHVDFSHIAGLAFMGSADFTGAGHEVRFEHVGGNTLVEIDTNGDSAADATLKLIGNIDLHASDFIL